jgi:hypothetical protein
MRAARLALPKAAQVAPSWAALEARRWRRLERRALAGVRQTRTSRTLAQATRARARPIQMQVRRIPTMTRSALPETCTSKSSPFDAEVVTATLGGRQRWLTRTPRPSPMQMTSRVGSLGWAVVSCLTIVVWHRGRAIV